MPLESDIKNAIIESISQEKILSINSFAWKLRKIIPPMREAGVVSLNDLRRACEEYIIRAAREDYYFCKVEGLNPEIHSRVEYLSYGIKKGCFSKRQLRKINFEDGLTPEEFARTYYQENLPEEMARVLVSPRNPTLG
jgi:hypothetical protein